MGYAMIKQQQKQHVCLDGDHAANDPVRQDLRQYHGDTLTLKHPSNRSKDNAKVHEESI